MYALCKSDITSKKLCRHEIAVGFEQERQKDSRLPNFQLSDVSPWSSTCQKVWSCTPCTALTANTTRARWLLFPPRPRGRRTQHLGRKMEKDKNQSNQELLNGFWFSIWYQVFIFFHIAICGRNGMTWCLGFMHVHSFNGRFPVRWRCITSDTRQRMTHGCPSTCWSARHCPRRRRLAIGGKELV